MIFNEDNLRAGLKTFTNKDRPRYAKAHENYSAKVNDGATTELALEYALAESVKGLPKKDEKLRVARRAAGFSRLYDLRKKHSSSDTSSSTTTKTLPITPAKPKNKVHTEKLPAHLRPFNVGFVRVGKWVIIVLLAIFFGFVVTWALEDVQRSMGNDPQDWIPVVVVPPFAALFIYITYLREKSKAKRNKERNEHRDPSKKERDTRREPSKVSSTPA